MTSGKRTGTGGEGIWSLGQTTRLYLVFSLLVVLICSVNVTSLLIEFPPQSRPFQVWEPILWEATSVLAYMSLLWLWPLIYNRYHYSRLGLVRFACVQIPAMLVFSLTHIALMVALRALGYGVAGGDYDFARGDLGLQVVYEMRKDALCYLLIIGVLWVDGRVRPSAAIKEQTQLKVHDQGRVTFVDIGDISRIEAAGNYVEIYAGERRWLMRGTLKDFEKRLSGQGFVRVHRSRLVNRKHIFGLSPLPTGDVSLTLRDGTVLMASRRFKAQI